MGIQPIDLQTLYTQMDKISKTAVQQQQGAVLQNSMMMDARLQKSIENKDVIEQAKKEDLMNGVKDEKNSSSGNGQDSKKKKQQGQEESEDSCSVLKDPALGKNLDIYG